MKQPTRVIIGIIVSLVIIGAGCAKNNQATPSFIKDAEEFSKPSGINIPKNVPGYKPAPPVAEPPLTYPKGTTVGEGVVPKQFGSVIPEYIEALSLYKSSGAYFQIANCQGTPGMMSIKKGVMFMIDNRDGKEHRIGVGSKYFNVGPYGFIITRAEKVGANNITCDGGGAALLNVES